MIKSFKIFENIVSQSIDNNVYILDIDSGEYYELCYSASLIWNEIEDGANIDDIKTKIKSKFVDDSNIGIDIDNTIKDLINLNLIKEN
jgi:hypothetical protein